MLSVVLFGQQRTLGPNHPEWSTDPATLDRIVSSIGTIRFQRVHSSIIQGDRLPLPLPPKLPAYYFRCDNAYQELYREGQRLQQYQLPFHIDLAFPVGCVKPMDKPASSQSSRADVYILLCSHRKCCGPLY